MANRLVQVCNELFPGEGICNGYLAATETTDPFKIYCRIELTFASKEAAKSFIQNHPFK